MTLVELINRYLKHNGMTKTAFAKKIGFSHQYVIHVLNTKCRPSSNFIKAVEANEELYQELVDFYNGKVTKERELRSKEEILAERDKKTGRGNVHY